jgi:hypothetical protein
MAQDSLQNVVGGLSGAARQLGRVQPALTDHRCPDHSPLQWGPQRPAVHSRFDCVGAAHPILVSVQSVSNTF